VKKRIIPIIGEDVEVRGREKVEGILRRHLHLSVVDEA
jgi:hypothetical protein